MQKLRIIINFDFMQAPKCIQNHILVELPKAFQDEIISDGGLKFYNDTTFRPEWHVTVLGTVVSTPYKLTIGDGKSHSFCPERPKIKQIVNVGDEIVFSYSVIMDRNTTDNMGDFFERQTPKNPFTTVWKNPNGLEMVRIYLNNDKYEIGLFDTRLKTWVDRINGGEREVESFMGKYMPTQNTFFNYGNLLSYEGKDYWKVDYFSAIAIKRADGSFEMIGDYCLVEPIYEPGKKMPNENFFIYNLEQDKNFKAIGKLLSIGEPVKGEPKLSAKPDDIICTDVRYREKYEIDGHDYWVVRQRYIYGKSVQDEHIGNP